MKLVIRSEKDAVELSGTLKEKTAIISITCPGEEAVKFADNPNIVSVFRMRFNDIDHDRYPEIKPPEKDDFKGLKRFIDNLDCETLLVHCGAGVSRSAAVAAAVNEYLGLGCQIFSNPNYCPNLRVYRYASEELGMQPAKDEKYYEKIFDLEM